jgi:hypothetical protein
VAVHVVELVVQIAHVVLHAAGDADRERAQVAEGFAIRIESSRCRRRRC